MNQQTPNLAESNFLQLWAAISDDPFSKSASDLLVALNGLKGPGPEGLLSRLLCYVYDVAVYQLGAVYGDSLPADENPDHYFVATTVGSSLTSDSIPSTATEAESFALAAKGFSLMDTYLADYAQRSAL
jgi:hypothetical protein